MKKIAIFQKVNALRVIENGQFPIRKCVARDRPKLKCKEGMLLEQAAKKAIGKTRRLALTCICFFKDRTALRRRGLSRRVISGKGLKHQSEFFA